MIEITNALYISEAAAAIIAWILGVIIYKASKRKGLLKYFGITSAVFVILFGFTFILEKPQMRIGQVQNIEVGTDAKIIKPVTTYHFKNVTDKVQVEGNVDYSKIGAYDITFTLNTLLGKYEKKEKVRVVDIVAPEIRLEGEEEYNQSYAKEYEEPGFKAIDNYDGDISDKVTISKEEMSETRYNLKYQVQDTSGNKAEKIRKVTIVDDVPPVIALNGSASMTVYLNANYEEKGAKAEDEKDGDLTNKIKIEGKVDTSKIGKYTITYKVSDNSGNEATKTRTVTVAEKKVIVASTVKAQDGSNGPKGVIYLTFDDGPSSKITPQILDVLKEKGVKATFFILNYNSTGEAIVKREIAEGHTVGIHGYSHEYKEIYKSEEAYMENITKLQSKIKASTGYNATITRFPGGSSNKVSRFNPGIMTRLSKLVVERGYKYFDWNVSSGDAGGAKSADDVYNNVIKGLSKSKQNVVLMHDTNAKSMTLQALPRIIDYGLANGYRFERITESTPMVTHKPNN